MTKAVLVSLEVPHNSWNTFPTERVLNSLAIDAYAAERRILKGYEIKHNQAMYMQIVNQMHYAGITLYQSKLANLLSKCQGSVLNKYLKVIQICTKNQQSNRIGPTLLMGFFCPGRDLEDALKANIRLQEILKLTPNFSEFCRKNKEVIDQINSRSENYQSALQKKSGILEIMMAL